MRIPPWKRTLYVVWTCQFISIAGANLVFPFLPLFIQDLGVESKSDVALYAGLSGTASGLAMFVFSPIWGAFSDRFGRKQLLVRAYFFAAITTGLMAVIQNVGQFLLLRCLMGASSGTVSAASGLVAASTPPQNVAYAMGILQVSLSLGGTMGPLIGGVLAEAIGMRATFLFCAGSFVVGTAMLVLFVQEDFTPPAVRHGPLDTFVMNIREAAASRTALLMVGIIFLVNSMMHFARPIIPLFVEEIDPTGSAARESGYVFAALAITSAVAAFTVGLFAERVGHRRTLVIALAGAGLAYLPVATAGSIATVVFIMAVVGIFAGGAMPTSNALLSINAPQDKQGSAFGMAGSAQALSMAVAPLLGGVVAASLGISTVFLVLGIVALVIAAFVAYAVPGRERAMPPVSEAVAAADGS